MALLCQIPEGGLTLYPGKPLNTPAIPYLGSQTHGPGPTSANTACAYAYFQEDSRDPTVGHFLLGLDEENICLYCPGPTQIKKPLSGEGKMIYLRSALFSWGKILPATSKTSQQQRHH